MAYVIDTNILLLILTLDDPEQSRRAVDLLRRAAEGELSLFISDVCMAEIAWTLESYYKLPRPAVGEKLMALLNTDGLTFTSSNVLTDTVLRYSEHNVDFADAYHAAIAANKKTDVYTYDRDYDRFTDIKRLEP